MNRLGAIQFFLRLYSRFGTRIFGEDPRSHRLYRFLYFNYKRYVEDPFAKVLRNHPDLLADGHVIDVGANIGYTASLFANYLSPGYKVFAFEPEQRNFLALKNSIEERKLSEMVTPIQSIVSAESGEYRLRVDSQHPGNHQVLTEKLADDLEENPDAPLLSAVSIDSFVDRQLSAQAISFIKIDVQGFELEVCRGMEKTLEKNQDLTLGIEFSPSDLCSLGYDPKELLAFFEERSYFSYVVHSGGYLRETSLDQVFRHTLDRDSYVDIFFRKAN